MLVRLRATRDRDRTGVPRHPRLCARPRRACAPATGTGGSGRPSRDRPTLGRSESPRRRQPVGGGLSKNCSRAILIRARMAGSSSMRGGRQPSSHPADCIASIYCFASALFEILQAGEPTYCSGAAAPSFANQISCGQPEAVWIRRSRHCAL